MIFRVTDDADSPAVGVYHVAFGDVLLCVVCAFGVDVGAKRQQEFGDGRLVEDYDVVNCAKGRDRLGSLALRDEGAALAFESVHLLVAVYADDEEVAEVASAFEVADVPDVQEVEAAIGEDDTRAVLARNRHARYQSVAFEYACGGVRLLSFVVRWHA